MIIIFISNFLNHHQKTISDILYNTQGIEYYFVSYIPMPMQFKKYGYPDYEKLPYNILLFNGSEKYERVLNLIYKADIMIVEGINNKNISYLINERLKTNKLIFYYTERWYKKVNYLSLVANFILGNTYRKLKKFDKPQCYVLCAGAYVVNDLKWSLAFHNKVYKWGYFPTLEKLSINQLLQCKRVNKKIELIWVARFIGWKHPELIIKALHTLRKEGFRNLHLTMIGGIDENDSESAELYKWCTNYIIENQLTSTISIIGNLPNEEVHKRLSSSDIFIFTSDRNEGWGAVLNEAMSNACACISSSMIGATPYLIKNGINGYIFKDRNLEDLIDKLKKLISNQQLREAFGREAYNSIHNEWSPQKAAENLLLLFNSKLQGSELTIENGPCSKAY